MMAHIVTISNYYRSEMKKHTEILQTARAPLSIRSAQAGRPVFHRMATVANIKYLALIFKYSNLFRERVKITTCPFFFSLAALNYSHGRIVPGKMQIGVHFPLAVRDLISHRFCTIYSRRQQRYSSKIIKIMLYKIFSCGNLAPVTR